MGKQWIYEGPVAVIWEPYEFSSIVLDKIDTAGDPDFIFDDVRPLSDEMLAFGVPGSLLHDVAKLKQKSYRIIIEEIEGDDENT